MSGSVRAFAPATVANVSCGFDVFGYALESPGDTVTARLRNEPGVGLAKVTGDGGALPRDARNTAAVAAARLLREIGADRGVELELAKGMPLASGLGSSAASSVAAVVAVDALLGTRLSPPQLLRAAVEGERAAAGFPHADNAAPCLAGGFVLVRGSGAEASFESIPVPDGLECAMLHPHVLVETRGARAVLPEQIPLSDAVVQWGNVAALVTGLFKGDFDLLAGAVKDVVVEPVRAKLVPGFAEVRAAALDAGAFACGLSGSGPSIFAWCRGREAAERAAAAMRREYARGGRGGADAWASRVGAPGARVLD
jgi:homoserine kinase